MVHDVLDEKDESSTVRLAMPRRSSDPVLPSEHDAVLADAARRILEPRQATNQPLHLRVESAGQEPVSLDLPPVVTRLLLDILKETAAGHAVTLVPVESDITPQQAAHLLDVSLPFLIGLIDEGRLFARTIGRQRRLSRARVLAYKADHFAKRSEALDRLVALDQDLGLE